MGSYSNSRMQELANLYSKFELFEYSLDALRWRRDGPSLLESAERRPRPPSPPPCAFHSEFWSAGWGREGQFVQVFPSFFPPMSRAVGANSVADVAATPIQNGLTPHGGPEEIAASSPSGQFELGKVFKLDHLESTKPIFEILISTLLTCHMQHFPFPA